MLTRTEAERGDRTLVAIVFALGVAWSLWLIAQVPDEVFYSGDGGVKALLVKQFVAGDVTPALRLAAPRPVLDAWQAGLYPLRPPFVYPTPSGQLVSFPMAFALVSTPFYALLGFRGFYAVPALSLWLTWWLFCRTLARERYSPKVRAGCLALLIFATHATLYSATFWEHTLGILLSYAGVDFVFSQPRHRFSARGAVLSGLCCGLAFSVRSEALLFIVALALLAVLGGRRTGARSRHFLLGIFVSVAGVLVFNGLTYGNVLGIHSRQVLEDSSLRAQIMGAADRGARLFANLLLHVPLFPVVLGCFGLRVYRERRIDWRDPEALLVACLLFLLTLPFIVPNPGARQMGPRYLLCLVPAVALVAAALLSRPRAEGARPWLPCLVLAAFVFGGVQNSVLQARRQISDYQTRILPALRFLRSRPGRLVVVNDSRLTQELEAELGPKAFVQAWDRPLMARALATARELGEKRPILVSFVEHDDISLVAPPEAKVRSLGIHGTIRFFEANLPETL